MLANTALTGAVAVNQRGGDVQCCVQTLDRRRRRGGGPGRSGDRAPFGDARGGAAATVASSSARVGDGLSSYEDGVLSAVNKTAASVGSG